MPPQNQFQNQTNADLAQNQPKSKNILFGAVVLIVILLVVGIVAAYFAFSPETKRASEIESIVLLEKEEAADKISDWQTYRNEEFGFEFKYDPRLIVSSNKSNSAEIVDLKYPYNSISDDTRNLISSINVSLISQNINSPEEMKNYVVAKYSQESKLFENWCDNGFLFEEEKINGIDTIILPCVPMGYIMDSEMYFRMFDGNLFLLSYSVREQDKFGSEVVFNSLRSIQEL